MSIIYKEDKDFQRLENLVKAKIEKVNEEAGHRSHLEVPELINLTLESIEEDSAEEVKIDYLVEWDGELSMGWCFAASCKTKLGAREYIARAQSLVSNNNNKYRILKRTTLIKAIE